MKKKGKIYLSGKVTGLPYGEVLQKFDDAERMLSTKGFQVVNPLKLIPKDTFNTIWQDQLRICLDALEQCTSIYMMGDAANCKIAQIEFHIAMEENFDIHYELENENANEPADNVHR